jgi:hypothetical protein
MPPPDDQGYHSTGNGGPTAHSFHHRPAAKIGAEARPLNPPAPPSRWRRRSGGSRPAARWRRRAPSCRPSCRGSSSTPGGTAAWPRSTRYQRLAAMEGRDGLAAPHLNLRPQPGGTKAESAATDSGRAGEWRKRQIQHPNSLRVRRGHRVRSQARPVDQTYPRSNALQIRRRRRVRSWIRLVEEPCASKHGLTCAATPLTGEYRLVQYHLRRRFPLPRPCAEGGPVLLCGTGDRAQPRANRYPATSAQTQATAGRGCSTPTAAASSRPRRTGRPRAMSR